MPDWHTIWRALVDANADPTPFGFFVVARVFDKLFGPAEIGIRLPSALAMIGGMWFTYDCARRLTNRLHGLIAMALLTCTFLPYYGYEGRCYALFFLFASAVLWTWTGRRSAILLGALFFFGTLIHYYLVLCLIPFAAEELWQSRPWRWPSARLISGGIGACAGIAALYPQIVSSKHAHGETWWAAPKIRDIASVFTDIFPAGLLLLAVVTI
jgi:4-amino-4-deoxy-L-arabinose transferase-like glycosyltransferase